MIEKNESVENEVAVKYRFEAGDNSWNIAMCRIAGAKAKSMKEGDEYWTPFKYFGNLEQAATALLQIIAREKVGDATDTQSILDAIESAKLDVIAAVKAVGEK